MTPQELAAFIDHTILKPDSTRAQVETLCDEARQYGFFSVCVAPAWIATCVRSLQDSPVKIATVVAFPHGNTLSSAKAAETHLAIEAGAHEIDMVLHVGALKSGDSESVRQDIAAVVEAASGKALVKVIFETSPLTDDEKRLACKLSEDAGADYVKTSTGFATGGATIADVSLMREMVGQRLGVKASGGIRDLQTAQAMIAAGASRLGCSASVAIVRELAESQ